MSKPGAIHALLRSRSFQLFAFTALMAVLGVMCLVTKYSVLDPDVWWHLKVGDWVVEHHAVPHTGIFSKTAADRPWVAYSWGYEVLLSRAYSWFGLIGVGWFGVLLTLSVAGTLFWVMRRLSGRFGTAWILTVVGCTAFLFSLMPRPVFFSMLLFSIILMLILEAQRSGRAQGLYWLPLIFAVWANLHIQFIYGLFVVGLFFGIVLLQRVAAALGLEFDFLLPPSVPLRALFGVTAASVLAACIGPYSFHLYQVVFEYSKAKAPYSLIMELQPLNFSGINDYLVLLLAIAGSFAVGWQQKLDPFKVVLLAVAIVVGFRTGRDGWFICIPTLAFIADVPRNESSASTSPQRVLERVGVAVALGLFLLIASYETGFNPRGLDRAISQLYPVDAANFIRRNGLPGPLYNSFDWGGFLIWYMPQYPVAIDGRNDLYGDELDRLFFSTHDSATSYTQDPYLRDANLVLIKSDSALAKMLALDRHFIVAYKDTMSVVFVRSQP